MPLSLFSLALISELSGISFHAGIEERRIAAAETEAQAAAPAKQTNNRTMGRILDAIRRKKTGPSTPTSLSDSPCTSPLNANNCSDKENASYAGNRIGDQRMKEALPLGNREVLVGEDIEACIEVTLSDSTSIDDDVIKKGSFETADGNDSELAAVASSESTSLSNATVSVSELTEVSDDGILRDDEGNPIDPDEAEKNMLRDDEGNIIDPKSLVVRDFLLDLSCESDEYYDDSGEHVDPKDLISCIGIGDARLPLVTDSSTHSEGEADADCECEEHVRPLHEVPDIQPLSTSTQDTDSDAKQEPTPTYSSRETGTYEHNESKGRKGTTSSRRRRRRRSSGIPAANDEYVHIMFNNRLTTLPEESLCSPQNTDDSGDEADDESPAPSPRNRQRSPRVNGIGSFDEKFIKARWEYSLQMMNCGGSSAIGAVIDVSTQ